MMPREQSANAARAFDFVPSVDPSDKRADRPGGGRSRALERDVRRLTARVAELEHERAAAQGFAATAAHELLEPLVMTEAYVVMLTDSLKAGRHDECLEDLETLGRASARVRLLVETLLHHARARGRELYVSEVDLESLVDNCLLPLRPELNARRARVDVEPLPKVAGEEVLLGGVFSNLLVNAMKYSPRDRTWIRVSARRRTRAWEISVDSEGPAIPAPDRGRIFEPFLRGSGERRAGGSGLGLTICRNIVERHGGRIGVSPRGASGNRFWFTVPDQAADIG